MGLSPALGNCCVAHPDVTDHLSPGNFQFSTLCSLCKGSNFASSKENLWLAPLLNCFHWLWHVYLHVHKLSRKRKEIGTQCALKCSPEWFRGAALLTTAGTRRWWCCWYHLCWRRGPLLSIEIYSPTKSASFRCLNKSGQSLV